MARGRGPTVLDKLLIAAFELDGGSGRQFSAEDLVVTAWKFFPRAFGLRGHNDTDGNPIYPDSNRVFAEVMGSKPIRKRGYLVKVGQKTYGLTPSGRAQAQRLAGAPAASEETGGKASLSRPVRGQIERLLASRAVRRAQDDELNRITFHDACGFWGITPRSTAIELEGALANVDSVIRDAEEAIGTGATELRTGSANLSERSTELLKRIQQHLQDRFSEELATIRKRTDQRAN